MKKSRIVLLIPKGIIQVIFIMSILVEPAYVAENIFWLDNIWDFFKIGVFIYILFHTIYYKKISKLIIIYIVFIFIMFLSTVINKGDFQEYYRIFLSPLMICLYMDYMIQNKPSTLLKGLYYFFGIYATLNMVSFLLYPKGLYVNMFNSPDCWFLGRDNSSALMMLFAMGITFIYATCVHKKITSGFLFINLIIYLFYVFVWSGTAVIGLSIMILLEIWLLVGGKINKKITMMLCCWLGFSANIAVVVFHVQNLFKGLIVDVLGKSLDLSGRTYLWEHVFQLIQSKFWLGYGIEQTFVKTARLGRAWAGTAHNFFLNIFYQGGCLAFLLLILLIYIAALNFDKNFQTVKAVIIPVLIFIMMIMFIAEAYQGSPWFYTTLLLAFHVSKVERD